MDNLAKNLEFRGWAEEISQTMDKIDAAERELEARPLSREDKKKLLMKAYHEAVDLIAKEIPLENYKEDAFFKLGLGLIFPSAWDSRADRAYAAWLADLDALGLLEKLADGHLKDYKPKNPITVEERKRGREEIRRQKLELRALLQTKEGSRKLENLKTDYHNTLKNSHEMNEKASFLQAKINVARDRLQRIHEAKYKERDDDIKKQNAEIKRLEEQKVDAGDREREFQAEAGRLNALLSRCNQFLINLE